MTSDSREAGFRLMPDNRHSLLPLPRRKKVKEMFVLVYG